MKDVKTYKTYLVKQSFLAWPVFVYIAAYWFFDAILDSFILQKEYFFTSLLTPDPMCLNMRLLNIPLIMLFAIITQWTIIKLKNAKKEKELLIQELQISLSEVKTLSGLLPICAWCKKIRDDAGYWHILEKYITDRSRALFSHGICPECAKKQFPNCHPK